MYLVTVLKESILTNLCKVNLTNEELAGMMPVFKRKRDAIRAAKQTVGAKVLEIERVK